MNHNVISIAGQARVVNKHKKFKAQSTQIQKLKSCAVCYEYIQYKIPWDESE